MRKVFADTGFFRVLADENDARYETVETYRRTLLENGYIFVLTDMVLAEVILRVRYDLDWRKAVFIGEVIRNGIGKEYELIDSGPYVWKAWDEVFKRYSDKRFSLADCISFAVMADKHIREVLTVDADFDRVNLGFAPIMIKE